MTHLSELLRRFGGECPLCFRGVDPVITSIALDSRRVERGAVFAALPGVTADGARFVPDALGRGAAAVLVTSAKTLPAPGSAQTSARTPVWTHPNAREVVGLVAAFLQGDPTRDMLVIGVTGTNGKTSVTHTTRELLELAGRRPGLIGTVSYRLADGRHLPSTHTTPDATVLQRLFAEHREQGGDSVVLEASSHALDQERLAGTLVDVAVFTNLTRDHLDYHADMESYAAAKERLFRMLDERGTAVVKDGDAACARMAEAARKRGARVVTYGIGPRADLRALDVRLDRSGSRITLEGMGIPRTQLTIPLVGRHNVENTLAALGAALASGVSPSGLLDGLTRLSPAPGRLEEVTRADSDVTVIVDYAHTDGALKEVLTALREVLPAGTGRLICVFGCGGARDTGKRAPMGRVVGELADVAVLTSDNPRNERPEQIIDDVLVGLSGTRAEVHVEPDRRRAIERAVEFAATGDIVLVAGKGHESTQEIAGVRHPFDDRIVVQEVLACLA
jgi:UDP-N-acetylmuramoyl-L-alanyl-D-glutamate--2,6-diaminopimelate ligase